MTRKLLVVGTSSVIEQLFKITLMDADFSVTSTSSHKEAENILSKDSPDIIFIDSSLKDKNAFEFSKSLKMAHKKPVILLKSSTDSWGDPEFNNSKADQILKKPFEPEALMSILEKYNNQNPNLSNLARPEKENKESSKEQNKKSALSLLKKAELENAKNFIRTNLVKKSKKTVSKQSKPILQDSLTEENILLSNEDIDSRIDALATNIIEKIAWEVVPKLAEAIIKKELKRLTEE
jgi:DNA-binding response OmpR family regulator